MMTRRGAFAAFAAALVAPVAAWAQAGGMPSSTAPSNSQGTPSTGGAIGTTQTERVPAAPSATTHRRRKARGHRHRKAPTVQ